MQAERPLEECTRWFAMLARHFPHLSRAQLRTLALWSFAATMTQHIASTTCAYFLARLFGQPQQNLRQRLREFYWQAERKPGPQRRALDAGTCFAPLLRWILSLYRADELVLALDVTLVRDRLALISLSVAFRGSALPVAWKVLPANEKGAWIPCCEVLLGRLASAVPDPVEVLVLCDRGLQSRKLFGAICEQGWHPMMRLTRRGTWCPQGQRTWYGLASVLPGPGRYYLGQGELFKTKPLSCTLIALWEQGYEAPWLLMTDLEPERCRGTFYGLRSWIERGFRCMKAGAYRCERLPMRAPARDRSRAGRAHRAGAGALAAVDARGGQRGAASRAAVRALGGLGRWGAPGAGSASRGVVHRVGWVGILVAALRGEALPLPASLFVLPRPEVQPGIEVVLNGPP